MYLIFFLITLLSCSTTNVEDKWQNFEGRSEGVPVYQAKIPQTWHVSLPNSEDYLTDTTLPIFTCIVPCDNEEIRIAIHNFPTQTIEQSIPAHLQIRRWQSQFQSIDPASLNYTPLSIGGFTGYLFEATGLINSATMSVLALAMQIIPEHYRTLQSSSTKEKEYKQMRADYTIKATGSPEAIASKREEILIFAESFELIHPIPARL